MVAFDFSSIQLLSNVQPCSSIQGGSVYSGSKLALFDGSSLLSYMLLSTLKQKKYSFVKLVVGSDHV